MRLDTRSWGTLGNSLPELFAEGFRAGLALWKSGYTFELISHQGESVRRTSCEAAGRGLFAASEALAGWLDIAEREARLWGHSRESASALVSESREAA